MYVRNNGERRPPSEQPRGRTQRPVHISQPRIRDIIPPPDYSGTALLNIEKEDENIEAAESEEKKGSRDNPDTGGEPVNVKRSATETKVDSAPALAATRLPFEEQIYDTGRGDDDDRPVPRRPLASRSDYTEEPDNRPVPRYPILRPDLRTAGGQITEQEPPKEASRPRLTRRSGNASQPAMRVPDGNPYIPAAAGITTHENTRERAPDEVQENDTPLPFTPDSDELLLCGLIILLMLSGSEDEMIILLAFLLLSH